LRVISKFRRVRRKLQPDSLMIMPIVPDGTIVRDTCLCSMGSAIRPRPTQSLCGEAGVAWVERRSRHDGPPEVFGGPAPRSIAARPTLRHLEHALSDQFCMRPVVPWGHDRSEQTKPRLSGLKGLSIWPRWVPLEIAPDSEARAHRHPFFVESVVPWGHDSSFCFFSDDFDIQISIVTGKSCLNLPIEAWFSRFLGG
jgi:hypothetical protein